MSRRRASGVNSVARVQLQRSLAAGERDGDLADSAMVRCRGCGQRVPVRQAVNLERELARAGRRFDGGSAWACRPCFAAASGEGA